MQENILRPVVKRFPQLKNDAKTEVLVVGGGITGVLCSYFLNKAGYETIVLEMDEVGSGASGASSGILYYGTGTNLVPAIDLWGRETAAYIWKETAKNVKELAALAEKNSLNCGLRRPGGIMVARTDEEVKFLEHEQAELAKIGIKHPPLSSTEVKQFYPAQAFKAGLHFHGCSQIYPALFAAELAGKTNLPLYEYTKMESVKHAKEGLIVKTPTAKISCSKIIFATNDFPVPPEKPLGIEKHFIQESSVIIASQKVARGQIKKIYPKETILWTMDKNYDIIYEHEGRFILELYRLERLAEKLAFYYPGFDFKQEAQWGSSWARVKDWLPLAGEFQPNIYTAMAMSDQGTTMGYTTAKHIVDMIEGRKNKYLELTDPKRLIKGFI